MTVRYKRYVFVTMQKCAGSYIRYNVQKSGGTSYKYQHLAASQVLREENDIFYGVHRNPFDWYTSLYFYGRKYNHRNTRVDFTSFIVEMTINPHKLLSHRFRTANPDRQPCNVGGMTYLYRQLFYSGDQCLIDKWLECRNVSQQLQDLLQQDISLEKDNTNEHPPYQEVFIPRTRDIIEKNDREYLDRFNYQYEDK